MSELQHNSGTWAGVPTDEPLRIDLLLPDRDKAIVLATGGMHPVDGGSGAEQFAWAIHHLSYSYRMICVAMAIQGGYLTGLDEAERTLRAAAKKCGAIIGLVDVACGPAFYLSQIIRDVGILYASPAAQLGMAVNPEGDSIEAQAERLAILVNLHRLNPKVHANTWFKLAGGMVVIGEQAEALDLVGGLKRDVFTLSGVKAEAVQ